LGLRK